MTEPPPLPDDWCAYHCQSEPGPSWYRCFECWHNFATADELIAADFMVRAELGIEPLIVRSDTDEIIVCPFCAHDF